MAATAWEAALGAPGGITVGCVITLVGIAAWETRLGVVMTLANVGGTTAGAIALGGGAACCTAC